MSKPIWVQAKPHVDFLGAPSPLPGDDRLIGGVDFKIETYPLPSAECAALQYEIDRALYQEGVVAPVGNARLFMQIPPGYGKPILKLATDAQWRDCPRLPDYWERYAAIEDQRGVQHGKRG